MTPFYRKIYNAFANRLRRFLKITVIGAENEPKEGGYILCANHTSNLDVIVIGAAMSRQVRYMTKKELFKIPLLGSLITAFGAYPVDRRQGDVSSIKKTISLVKDGEVVGIFPQGHRYKKVNPRETEVKSGVGMLAYRSKATVVPVFIRTPKNYVTMFCKKEVIIGKAIPFEELGFENGGQDEYSSVTRMIFDKLCDIGEGRVDG